SLHALQRRVCLQQGGKEAGGDRESGKSGGRRLLPQGLGRERFRSRVDTQRPALSGASEAAQVAFRPRSRTASSRSFVVSEGSAAASMRIGAPITMRVAPVRGQ